MQMLLSVGKEIREKFSGNVEAFSRRNLVASTPFVDRTKYRTSEDVAVHKDLVILFVQQEEYINHHLKFSYEKSIIF